MQFSSLEIGNFVHLSYFRLCGVSPLFLPYCLLVSVQHYFHIEWKFFNGSKNSVEKYCFLKRRVSWVGAYLYLCSLLIVQSMIYLYEKFDTPAAFLLISVFLSFWKLFSRFRSRFHNILFLKETSLYLGSILIVILWDILVQKEL